MGTPKVVIGRNVFVDLVGHAKQVPAKVDTGADTSSVWASDIEVLEDGTLQYTLFGTDSPFYDGKIIKTKDYKAAMVRSSSGHTEIRYQATLSLRIKGKRIRATFNLSNRSRNQFPILIGRRTLNNKFIVDVTIADVNNELVFAENVENLNAELAQNPHAFYKKYHTNKKQ